MSDEERNREALPTGDEPVWAGRRPSPREEHAAVVAELLRRAEGLGPEAWRRPRAPGKWSAGQEVRHLALAYAGFAGELRDGPDVTPETFAERIPGIRESALPRIRAGGWFPAGGRSPRSAVPPEEPGEKEEVLAALRQGVASYEAEWLTAASQNSGRHVRHPFFGALTLEEHYRVAIEHTRHHTGALPEPGDAGGGLARSGVSP